MLRTHKTDRSNAASNRARRSTADSASTAATLLSPLLCRPLNWRHSQLPHVKALTTCVAKNAIRDRSQSATQRPTNDPPLAATQRGARGTLEDACCISLIRVNPPNPRQSASYSSPASLATTPTTSQPTTYDLCRQKRVSRQKSPSDKTQFASRPHSSTRTASSISAVRGIPCCARACSVTCTAFAVGSSGACSIRACTCVISAPNSRMRHE
jgi:hypothetical protein